MGKQTLANQPGHKMPWLRNYPINGAGRRPIPARFSACLLQADVLLRSPATLSPDGLVKPEISFNLMPMNINTPLEMSKGVFDFGRVLKDYGKSLLFL
jgi:hypothetical protein